MSARIRLPDGRTPQWDFSPASEAKEPLEEALVTLYFSENIDLILADYQENPFIQLIDIEKVSWLDGISFQIQVEDGAGILPVSVRLDAYGGFQQSGQVSPGLFNWFWNFRIPGPVPPGPFRLRIQFA